MNNLTVAERQSLIEYELIIEQGLKTFVEVGTALLKIRDARLYQLEHDTFEDYCRNRWGMQRHYANRLIAASEVVQSLVPMGTILPATERQARPLTQLEPEDQPIVWQRAVESAPNGRVTAAHVQEAVDGYREASKPHVAAANHAISDTPGYDGDEWYTPSRYIELARRVMGSIDLDPASCPDAQATVKAGTYYTRKDDSLRDSVSWFENVWLNPPYSMPLIKQFVTKLIDQYENGNVTQAIILVNNSSDTSWFHMLLDYPVCLTSGRIQFWRPDHSDFGTRQGQAIFYLGNNVKGFASEFSDIGKVLIAYDD